ncbi:MAG: hypothetical protein ACI9Y1_002941 [Lentisphaeria bacterium]|jgi:hypothetical protein
MLLCGVAVSPLASAQTSGYARPPDAAHAMPLIQFSIKPRLCVLSEGEQVCRDELEISWTSKVGRSLCLYQSEKRLPLRCWEDELNGEHYIEISTSRNIDFQLKEMVSDDLLVTEAFEVVQDNTQYRRRRRNAWSFF